MSRLSPRQVVSGAVPRDYIHRMLELLLFLIFLGGSVYLGGIAIGVVRGLLVEEPPQTAPPRGQPDDWPLFPGAGAEAAYLESRGWSDAAIGEHLRAIERDRVTASVTLH